MKKIIGFLLVTSLSLYSTPLKADSYDNTMQSQFNEDPSVSDEGCSVSRETTNDPELDQNVYVEQEATDQNCLNNQTPSEDQNTHVDNGNYADQETLVSPANTEQSQQVRNKAWRNILLAVVVVAVAVTAMLLVHSHQGHKDH